MYKTAEIKFKVSPVFILYGKDRELEKDLLGNVLGMSFQTTLITVAGIKIRNS